MRWTAAKAGGLTRVRRLDHRSCSVESRGSARTSARVITTCGPKSGGICVKQILGVVEYDPDIAAAEPDAQDETAPSIGRASASKAMTAGSICRLTSA